MNKATQVLERARELISKPEAWTQKVMARDSLGRGVPTSSESAVSWCAVGAVLNAIAAFPVRWAGIEGSALDLLGTAIAWDVGEITSWNDSGYRIHAEVLAAFDKAIELSKKESP